MEIFRWKILQSTVHSHSFWDRGRKVSAPKRIFEGDLSYKLTGTILDNPRRRGAHRIYHSTRGHTSIAHWTVICTRTQLYCLAELCLLFREGQTTGRSQISRLAIADATDATIFAVYSIVRTLIFVIFHFSTHRKSDDDDDVLHVTCVM